MKYEAEIDLRNVNTSHALLVELIGPDRRVLDVGCATGYLGRVLKQRGCRVSGVELDPEAAEAAEQVLDTVLVGDVQSLDLVGHFGKESFDVVVFGDVLEHVADPGAVLRKVLPLLSEWGSVVASVPNVAHGAVRLALLSGRFDYRPLGLLDSTHLRFFTRESLHHLFRESGLVPVDMRRTTAGVFETEVQVRRDDFEQSVVDAVEGDPESSTYQFVLRAVPEDSPSAIDAPTPPPPSPARCRVGVWADWEPDDLRQALIVRITCAELARRLPGSVVRPFSSSAAFRPSPHDGGLAVEPLGGWSHQRAGALAAELDCAVVVGDLPDAAGASGAEGGRYLLEGLGPDAELECPVVWSAVRTTGGAGELLRDLASTRPYVSAVDEDRAGGVHAVPDPLVLAPRALHGDALARRLEFTRMMGWFPRSGAAVVVETHRSQREHAEAVAGALDELVAGGASVVLVGIEGPGDGGNTAEAVSQAMSSPAYRVPPDALVDDVVAVIAGADAFAACTTSGVALGLAYERPVVDLRLSGAAERGPLSAVVGDGAVVTAPDQLRGLADPERFRPHAGALAPLQTRIDAHFDRIATIADAAAAVRPRPSGGPSLVPAPEQVAAMELAHRRMQERLDAERRAVGDHLVRLRVQHEAEVSGARAQLEAARAERDMLDQRLQEADHTSARRADRETELERRVEAVTAELEALKGIRVLRLLRPARALYARLRGGRL